MERIGLFGGSFNPVHLGHLLIAQAALQELELSRLFFIPAAQSPFKPEGRLAPAAERLRLLRLALEGQNRCSIDEQELQRGGVSYSIETVREYARRWPGAELWYIIGGDHVPLLPKWREATELAARAQFAVVLRPGQPAPVLPAPFQGRPLRGWPITISSSEIRERVQQGRPLTWLVPKPVEDAIANNRLYL